MKTNQAHELVTTVDTENLSIALCQVYVNTHTQLCKMMEFHSFLLKLTAGHCWGDTIEMWQPSAAPAHCGKPWRTFVCVRFGKNFIGLFVCDVGYTYLRRRIVICLSHDAPV